MMAFTGMTTHAEQRFWVIDSQKWQKILLMIKFRKYEE